jgi:hypothetical protein
VCVHNCAILLTDVCFKRAISPQYWNTGNIITYVCSALYLFSNLNILVNLHFVKNYQREYIYNHFIFRVLIHDQMLNAFLWIR